VVLLFRDYWLAVSVLFQRLEVVREREQVMTVGVDVMRDSTEYYKERE
jgi:hypothetical protein